MAASSSSSSTSLTTALKFISNFLILHVFLFTLIPFPFPFLPAVSSSTSDHYPSLRSLHFSLYQHETINKTGFIIVPGVTGPGVSQTTTPFGTLFVFQDPLTTAAERTSKLVGTAEGTSITSGLDGLRSISIAKVSLRLKHHSGSVSVVGGTHNVKASNHPVVGGTGDFLFVQGYVTSSPVDLVGITVVYKLEFHLYWPPYAPSPKSY